MDAAQGQVDERFAALADVFAARLADGSELGASLCLIHQGRTVVDLWGGWADAARTEPWTDDTLATVWSTTKTMTNLAALVLIDRGELAPDERVAHYWPEFAAAGKDAIEVRHVLGHTSGVAGWDPPTTMANVYDWDVATAALAAQEPWWEPGTRPGYHLLTQGHLVGELVRRVTGLSLGAFVAREMAGPLGADFHVGLGAADASRVTPMQTPRAIALDAPEPGSAADRALHGPYLHPRETRSTSWLAAEVPGGNGHGNARSVARAQAVVSHGGTFDGVTLLSEKTVERIFDVEGEGIDLVLRVPVRFGLGYALPQPRTFAQVPAGRRCFWGGYGGSLVVNDLEHGFTFAYVMNRMVLEHVPGTQLVRPCGDARSDAYLAAIYEALR